jgi:MYXO-CTERM domain-containing protein
MMALSRPPCMGCSGSSSGAAGFVLAVAFAVALVARRRSLAVAEAAAAIAPWVFPSVA